MTKLLVQNVEHHRIYWQLNIFVQKVLVYNSLQVISHAHFEECPIASNSTSSSNKSQQPTIACALTLSASGRHRENSWRWYLLTWAGDGNSGVGEFGRTQIYEVIDQYWSPVTLEVLCLSLFLLYNVMFSRIPKVFGMLKPVHWNFRLQLICPSHMPRSLAISQFMGPTGQRPMARLEPKQLWVAIHLREVPPSSYNHSLTAGL